ncbi:MAG: hypothetical protein WDM79_14065 [Terricaulis sp.]
MRALIVLKRALRHRIDIALYWDRRLPAAHIAAGWKPAVQNFARVSGFTHRLQYHATTMMLFAMCAHEDASTRLDARRRDQTRDSPRRFGE